jgi:hypothetical protein
MRQNPEKRNVRDSPRGGAWHLLLFSSSTPSQQILTFCSIFCPNVFHELNMLTIIASQKTIICYTDGGYRNCFPYSALLLALTVAISFTSTMDGVAARRERLGPRYWTALLSDSHAMSRTTGSTKSRT